MKPMRNLIVMEMEQEPEEKKSGGLLLQKPRWAKPQNVGKAIEVGPEVNTVEVGRYYLINPYSVIDTGEKHIKLVRESDILCHIPETKKQ